jgi:hypothetical protein
VYCQSEIANTIKPIMAFICLYFLFINLNFEQN